MTVKGLVFVLILAQVVFLETFGISQETSGRSSVNDISLRLRFRQLAELNPNTFQVGFRNENWQANETAIIVCDFWDYHHCLNAVRRMKEFGPRLKRLVDKCRQQGVTIVHSPSDCMPAYEKNPARIRVLNLPNSKPPAFASSWCSRIPAEEKALYPIDQSDGGEDDDPAEHAAWSKQLADLGRNPNMPWQKQNDMIPINEESDFISDRGDEVWRILKHKKIKNVILVGVHTNMCVLGRPFGLRQMKRFGMNVVLVRDMTDTMYNPKRWPFVSHYTGNDLVVSHIEKYVCPTITSEQIIGGKEFVFSQDRRPHLGVVMGESEYKTEQTLPGFAEALLPEFRISFFAANPKDRNDFPGIKALADADMMLLSVRRRVLKPEQMAVFRKFESAGKPIIGIRTASHAFSLRNAKPPLGYEDWSSLDSSVFGGNYTNHYGNKMKSVVQYTEVGGKHPITRKYAFEKRDIGKNGRSDLKTFGQNGSLYKTSPLAEGAEVLMVGTVLGHPPEPVSWTYERVNGGRSFYTSMGHPRDFENSYFVSLLSNAVRWAAGKKLNKSAPLTVKSKPFWRIIDSVRLPSDNGLLKFKFENKEKLDGLHTLVAFRKVINFPKTELDARWVIQAGSGIQWAWLNGKRLESHLENGNRFFVLPPKLTTPGEANWLVLGAKLSDGEKANETIPVFVKKGDQRIGIPGTWEWMQAEVDFQDASKFSLPAKFGGSPQIYFELK